MSNAIAIIGIGCRYPDANSPKEFWENILAKRRAFRRIPDERLSLESYYSSDRNEPDKTYSPYAALIHGFEFDRVRYRIAGSTFRATDIAQWLALQVAQEALHDAGYDDPSRLPRDTTGVILGNTLAGEVSRANTLRLRWPYVRKTLLNTLINLGVVQPGRDVILNEAEKRFKSAFPPMNHENLAGGLSNTIPGRICNYFDFHGGGYTVDGACAASLLAVSTACAQLETHDLDVALAGGVDISLDPFELIGFAKMGALAEREMFVYDERSSGFLPGEGCGMIVLKRLEDAVDDGNRIYAVIRGWGISSDGQGGLTTPSTSGQAFAVRRAYKRAGYDIATVSLIEGHGTGTTVGDRIELAAVAGVVNESSHISTDERPMIGVGSVKANIGHTKAAAGVAGLIKATLAVYNQILPPMPGCNTPHEEFRTSAKSLYPLRSARSWDEHRPLRAGVSAFGFGGINTHLTIESLATHRRSEFTPDERRLITSSQDSEIFFFAARRTDELKEQLQRIFQFAARISQAEMTDLAAMLARELQSGDVRAAIVASRPEELSSKLEQLLTIVGAAGGAQEFSHIDTRAGIFLARSARPVRVGYLYPGQGVQQVNMGQLWYQRYDAVREGFVSADQSVGPINGKVLSQIIFRDIDRSTAAEREQWKQVLTQTRVAQPAIAATSVVMSKILKEHGVTPSLAIGYSLGEWTALWSNGTIAEEDLCRYVSLRGRAMESTGSVRGGMATVAAPPAVVEEIVRSIAGYVTIAGYNTPKQAVVSGEYSAVQDLIARCRDRSIPAISLKVSNAFHSQLVSSAADILREELRTMRVGEAIFPVISTITGMDVKRDQVKDNLCDQILMPVRFLDAVREAERFGIDVLVEVGPGRSLSNMLSEIDVRGLRCVLFTDDEGGTTVRPMNMTLACLFALGVPIRASHLFDVRFTRPIPLDYHPAFIQNPCESDREALPTSDSSDDTKLESIALTRANATAPASAENSIPPKTEKVDSGSVSNYDGVLSLVLDLAASITEYPRELVKPENLLLHDLNLNSIASAQLVTEAARTLGLARPADPTEYSTVSLQQVAQTLFELLSTQGARKLVVEEEEPPGMSAWVRPFRIEMEESRLPDAINQFLQPQKRCLVIGEERDPLLRSLTTRLAQAGIVVDSCHTSLEVYLNDSPANDIPWDAFIYVHPHRSDGRSWDVTDADLSTWHNTSVQPLFTVAQAIARWCTAKKKQDLFVGVVQQSGGFFGRSSVDASDNPFACCSGVFKSLHLELNLAATCIVDCDPLADAVSLSEVLLKEFRSTSGFRETGYGNNRVRRSPVLRLLEHGMTATQPLDRSDVLLITGGGRGVAAEWALTLARETGCKVALLGRTLLAGNGDGAGAEVRATLQRFDNEKLLCRYYTCDVVDKPSLERTIALIRRDLGGITAVLHAAGTNIPQATRNLTGDAVAQTLAPKIRGTIHILQALPLEEVKLFITFGSIIAQSGMPGQTAYAFANEWMNRAVLQLQRAYPSMRCLSLNSSVWAGVGMGERLGSVDALAREGVTPIEMKTGLKALLELLRHKQAAPEVIMCGRVRRLPTLRLHDRSLPVLRFLERNRVHYPGVELITECELSTAHDLYLNDHFVDGMHLFPAVLGIEAMVQAASSLLSGESCAAVERLEFPRAIMVSPDGSTRIRIIAQADENSKGIEVVIRSSETNFALDHFRGHVIFGSRAGDIPDVTAGTALSSEKLLPISPREDLYSTILFQGPMFQHLVGYRELSATSCVAEIQRDDNPKLFGMYQPHTLLTGDPTVRDTFLHAIQPCVPQAMI
ncbi:MAG: SDR family NAD(P)-dependent oxidoreductase, partial [Ignavibacteriae bacterium]|nr:SDR family NAD(P)-dependent oxidoreductase [Ignavibacteriota bacterium]